MIVTLFLECISVAVLGLLMKWENTRRDKLQLTEEGGFEARDLDATAFADLTDRENLKYVNPHIMIGSTNLQLTTELLSSFRYIY